MRRGGGDDDHAGGAESDDDRLERGRRARLPDHRHGPGTGLGKTEARIGVELFGPFATRDGIRCTGEPYWTGEIFAQGDGTLRTPPVELKQAGFYTYREHLVGAEFVQDARTACGDVAETALARPLILTGRNERVVQVRAAAVRPARAGAGAAGGARASTLRSSRSAIDLRAGALAAPENIRRLGWWRDGADLGSATGSVLIAGHVDSRRAGPGAFFALRKPARRPDPGHGPQRARLHLPRHLDADGAEGALPTAIYSRGGPHRLVLVTCGGPFVPADGAYRDNVIVTAVRGSCLCARPGIRRSGSSIAPTPLKASASRPRGSAQDRGSAEADPRSRPTPKASASRPRRAAQDRGSAEANPRSRPTP